MTNTETKEVYERGILDQLIKNAERLAVLDERVARSSEKLAVVELGMNEVKADVAILKTNVATLQTDMSEVKPKVEAIYKTLGFIKTALITIGVGVLIGILSNISSLPFLRVLEGS